MYTNSKITCIQDMLVINKWLPCHFTGYGRFMNSEYRNFLDVLEETKILNNEENKVISFINV